MRGFSLIEMVIVLAIISLVGSISVVTYNTMRQVGYTKQAGYVFSDALKEAKSRAKFMTADIDWGVKINPGEVVIFGGSSYAGRNESYDKIYNITNDLSLSGPEEIVFSKFTGQPDNFGTTTFSNAFGTTTIFLSETGMINY